MGGDSYPVTQQSEEKSVERVPWYKQLIKLRLTFVVILTPIVCLPIPILFASPAGKCAYAILIMATFWMTEVIPMAVTALLPVVIMPWLGIMDTKDICQNYLKDANMLFFGGLMVAVAVERWNLHKRIAIRVLMLVGTKPPWLMFGFMATTAFLSMWISNTATAAMMIPISHAVQTELENHRRKKRIEDRQRQNNVDTVSNENIYMNSTTVDVEGCENHPEPTHHISCNNSNQVMSVHNNQAYVHDETDETKTKNSVHPVSIKMDPDQELEDSKEDEYYERVGKGMRLCIAYAANIGGTATLTGTGPNLVLKGQIDVLYGSETGINFSSWFVFAFPNMIISLALAWLWLLLLFIGPREILTMCKRSKKSDAVDSAKEVINSEYRKLGKISFAEVAVLVHFIILALLWLTRDPEVVPGWGSLLPKKYVSDSCVAITISILLFIFPSRWPNYLCFRRKSDDTSPGPAPALLDWPTIHKQIPWNVMLLLGGGFALADACKVSGLSQVIGKFFISFQYLPTWVLALVLSSLTAAFTEVTSNVATATIFLPILAELANSLLINPLYLMLPVTISASFAFMLPVATPPNAIVFAYGNMKILDMMKAGLMMNIMCLLVLQIALNTWANLYFGLEQFPVWAMKPNVTGTVGTALAFNISAQ